MRMLHLILKNSFCCRRHCFVLTCVCHHPPHSQRIDKKSWIAGEMCALKWNVSSNAVSISLQQCRPTQEKKACHFHEPCSLKFKYPPSLSPSLLYPAPPSPPNLFCSADYKRASSPHLFCPLPVSHFQSPVALSPRLRCASAHYGLHRPAGPDLDMQNMHPSCSQVVMVGGWWVKKCYLHLI